MSIIKEQHQALNDALVPREQHLRIGNYNYRLSTTFKPKKPTFQVALDKFIDAPFEEEILAFIRELSYPKEIKSLSDVKVDTLYQPWRTFGTIINKCLSGKVTGLDQLRLSWVQIIWGTYFQNNVDYVYLLWEDLVYQIENKVIPKPKYVRRSTSEKTEQAPTASPGKRLKAIAKKSSDEDDDDEVSMSKDDDENVDNEYDDGQDDDNEQTKSDNDGDDFVHPKFSTRNEEERHDKEDKEEEGDNIEEEKLDEEQTNEEEEVNKMYDDVNINLKGRDTKMTDALLANVQTTQVIEDTHVIITIVTPEVQQQSSSVSSGFISNMLNPNPDTGIDSILNLNTESTSLVDVPITTNAEMPPSSITTLPLPPIPLIQPMHQTLVSTPTIAPSTSLQNLPTFGSLFKFEDRVKSLEDDFSKFKQTNLFAEAVSLIPDIVDKYLANQMNEAVKEAILLTTQLLDWFQKPTKPPTPDRDWNKTLLGVHGPIQPWIITLAQNEDLFGPTFKLMKGSCKSLVELEYFLEEVYKVTTDQLD
ncbi:hypothetical protein Tco_1395498 [Tanacetum coccineum]